PAAPWTPARSAGPGPALGVPCAITGHLSLVMAVGTATRLSTQPAMKGGSRDRGSGGPRPAARREPAENAAGGRGRREHLFGAADNGAGTAEDLCPGACRGARRVADQCAAPGHGGERAEPHPIRRDRLPVVRRGGAGPDRRT